MRAAVFRRFGGKEEVRIEDIPTPRAGPGEVLVKVSAAALNPKDVLIRKGRFAWAGGRKFPQVMGFDCAGSVVEMGPEVTGLAPGDMVFGHLGGFLGGTCAEYAVMPAEGVARMPRTLDAVQAASLSLVSQTALQALRDEGNLQPGQRVYIHGASGGLGTVAVQVAKALGAHVTAAASAESLPRLKALGADEMVDRKAGNVHSTGERYDVYFDVFGNQAFGAVREALAPRGTWVTTVFKPHTALSVLLHGWRYPRARIIVVKSRRADLEQVAAWVDAGVVKPVIHAVMPLDRIVDAQAQLESKTTHGKLVLLV